MSDDPDNVVLRHLRDMMRDHRTLLAGLLDQGQRLERRIGELDRRMGEIKDDIELMLKAELMARMGNFESRFEARIGALESQAGDAP